MLINLKVKTLDAQTHEFSIDNEITVREFKDKVAEKTNIAADQQRIIYCGRVMVDDKQLKEYADLDGKVVHVAERPPPSQRLPASDTSGTPGANNTNERRTRNRAVAGSMRNSPLFRALDGMVVGTMAFPMNPNVDNQAPVNPFAASSSFCMNRITVARHMLDCANNIAAYLEDPSRGLNNQPLDILARGRWTMESTVVEVGITSDIPQSQQIVEMVQDAVQAAFRVSGNTNVTLVQLPTVFSSDEPDTNNSAAAAATDTETTANDSNIAAEDDENPPTAAATDAAATASVVIEDVVDDDEDTPTNAQSNNNSTTASPTFAAAATTAAAGTTSSNNNENSAASGSNGDSGADNSRRRTGTPVLAGVIEQLRNVQNRLNPFIEQYYDLLQNEPTFEENDNTGRENAQRLFDRVSEAFHYLSHAQHAISDLMLDVSQARPRYLTCRPILVEQSGYVSSNNFLTPAFIPALRPSSRNISNANASNNASNLAAQLVAAAARSAASTAAAATINSNATNNATVTTARSGSVSGPSSPSTSDANNSTVDDPVDDPVVWSPPVTYVTPSTTNNNANASTTNNNATASGRGNFQRQVARLLQDVVSAAPYDTEFHVHINTPNVVSIDVPIGVIGSSGGGGVVSDGISSGNRGSNETANNTTTTINNNDSNSTTTTTTPTALTTTTTTNDNININNTTTNSSSSSSSSSTANPARVTTATLPTTSTQTRSTSRPQVHIGNIPVLGMPTGWNGRVIPSNNVSSFDRFLPCNSHHIRETETSNNATTDNGSTNATASASTTPTAGNRNSSPGGANVTNINTRRRPPHIMNNFVQRMRRAVDTRVLNPNSTPPRAPVFDFLEARERFARGNLNRSSASTSTQSSNITSNNLSRNTTRLENRNRNIAVGSIMLNTTARRVENAISEPQVFDFPATREIYRRDTWPQSSSSMTSDAETNQDTQRLNIHTQLMNYLNNHIFEGQPINDDTIPPAINRALQWFGESLLYLPQYEKPEYDSRDSLFNILRSTLPTVIELLKRNPVNPKEFEQRLKQICEQFRKRLYSVLYICIGRANAEIFWVQLMRLLGNSIQTNLCGDVVEFLALYLKPTIPSATDEADAQQFIVLRNSPSTNTNCMEMTFVSPPPYFHSQPMDTDVEMSETTATTSQPEIDDEPLPPVVPGSAAWHRHFPNDWLPIITRDIQSQTDNPPTQSPFSDAYISGMSSKRRKLVQNSKPPAEISALIADSVRKAIQNPGHGTTSTTVTATPANTPDDIARAIASDAAVQTACVEAVRTNVRERLKKDPDFEAEKFPKSNKFIKK